ncbi:hypothetical protein ASPZODRAFT_66778 [Penicilliopsis zonata CBS 506.65]|uniref:Aspergillopepsin n=1 Tax=Penicilliopsis zonata CBS 506.65 TaxID=1073090 RepID=A0A1L9SH91_9EURO|nr:hypothetical protein ASPZODRAFT_66778 [Penicilliopsis zonata CBS 506.65]OJJ46444.1 hypothetical protein ASPZODRAFT_66778 [Penicilliopsis zonata CBS 506.65]
MPLNHQLHRPPYKRTVEDKYSDNWAGAVLVGTGYNSVTAEFTVPTPSAPPGGNSSSEESYCAAAWVGIDGDTCETAILQSGVNFCVKGSEVSFNAWYEWYPEDQYTLDLAISAGDVVKVTVMTSNVSSTATIENTTTDKSAIYTFANTRHDPLCEYNAEWIVEDFKINNNSFVPFADFGTVTFSSASAGTTSGDTVGPADATLFNIIQENGLLTSVSVTEDSVTVTYI